MFVSYNFNLAVFSDPSVCIGRPTASFNCPWNTQNNLSTNQKWVSVAGKHKLTIYGHNTKDNFSDATSYTNTWMKPKLKNSKNWQRKQIHIKCSMSKITNIATTHSFCRRQLSSRFGASVLARVMPATEPNPALLLA